MIVGISGYVGNRLTGIGRVLIAVLTELAKNHPEDHYVLFKNYDFNDYQALNQFDNISLVDVPFSKNSGLKNIVWHQWLFQKLLKKYECDVAYIPNFTLLLRKKIPTVVTIHDLIEFNIPDKFSRKRMFYRKKICDPLMAKHSDHILTVSKSSYNDIIKYLDVPESKITLTPNATDKTFFKKYDEKDVQVVLNKFSLEYKKFLLFVGTIDYPGKNIKTVMEAFFRMKACGELQGKKLVIVGKNGHNSQVIYDYVNSSKFKNEVLFTGYLDDEDLPKLYCGASIMLYLSLFEGFGLPVLEAMSCGTPVICPNTSCFPEIVDGLDVCVPPTDVSAIVEKIRKIETNFYYEQELAEMCYKRSQEYSWQSSAEIYHEVFSKLSNS